MENRQEKIRGLVMKKYADIAKGNAGGCSPSCCGESRPLITIQETGKALGCAEEDLLSALGEVNLGLGCGNPTVFEVGWPYHYF